VRILSQAKGIISLKGKKSLCSFLDKKLSVTQKRKQLFFLSRDALKSHWAEGRKDKGQNKSRLTNNKRGELYEN